MRVAGELDIEFTAVITDEPDGEELRVRQVSKLAVDEDDWMLRARCGAGVVAVRVDVHSFAYRTRTFCSSSPALNYSVVKPLPPVNLNALEKGRDAPRKPK